MTTIAGSQLIARNSGQSSTEPRPEQPARARNPDCGGAATYASLRTATEWHRALFREPPPRQYDDDYDDDEVAV